MAMVQTCMMMVCADWYCYRGWCRLVPIMMASSMDLTESKDRS